MNRHMKMINFISYISVECNNSYIMMPMIMIQQWRRQQHRRKRQCRRQRRRRPPPQQHYDHDKDNDDNDNGSGNGINKNKAWWRHQIGTFCALPAICAENSPVPGEFPAQRPVTRSFNVFFDLRPNKRLSKQWWGWWFWTPSSPLWRHCNGWHGLYTQRHQQK